MPLLPRVEDYASGVPQPDLVAKPPLTEGGQEKEPFRETIRGEGFQPYVPGREEELLEDLLLPEVYEDQSAHAAWTPMEVSAIETGPLVSEAPFEFAPKKEEPIVELALPEVQEKEALYEPEVEKKLPTLEAEPEGAEMAFPLEVERVKEMSSVEELILPEVQEQETLGAEERKEEAPTVTMTPVFAETQVLLPPWKEKEPELQARELQAEEALKASSVVLPSAYAPPPMPLLPRVEDYASGVPQPDLVAKPPLTEGGQEKEPFREIIRGEGFQPYVPGREQELHEDLLLPEVYEDQSAHAAWTPVEVSAIETGPLVSEAPFEFAPKKEEPIVELALPEVQEKEALYEPEVEKKLPTLEAEPEGAEMAFPLEVERVKEMSSVEELILPEVQEQETLGAEERKEEASTVAMTPVYAETQVLLPPWKEKEPELQARELQAEEALKASSVVLPSAYTPPPMPLLPRVEDYASGVPQPDLVAKPPLTEGGQEKEPFREIIRGEGFQPYVPGREQELHEDLLLPEVYEDQSAHAAWTPVEVSAIETGPLVSEAPFEFAPKKEEPIVELALPEVQEKEALYEPEVEKKLPTLEAEPEGAEMAFPLEVERVKEMSSVEELILPEVQEQETLGAEERKEEAVHRYDDTGLRGDSSIAAAMERKRTRAASTGTSSRGSA
ncbi:hypothetical protein V5799_021728 [Amblyomma americanum]|uniref:Uncharacterized protein n=1 Tax=Amblyomma americanum TaxID=6943 RepID=A0AAQ4FMN5_AMBAM